MPPSHSVVTSRKIQTLDKLICRAGKGSLQVKESLGGIISVRNALLKKPVIYLNDCIGTKFTIDLYAYSLCVYTGKPTPSQPSSGWRCWRTSQYLSLSASPMLTSSMLSTWAKMAPTLKLVTSNRECQKNA